MADIEAPTLKLVNACLEQWATLDKYVLQEKCLSLLVRELRPENSEIVDVLLKVSTLNDFYSTNIYDTHSVAKHIANLKIDSALHQGDLALVNKIALVKIGHKTINFYSFATKYCSHHRPDIYPIYDRYVDRMLQYFKKKDRFARFTAEDLKNYPTFVSVIDSFRKYYGLEDCSRKQIDAYLWLTGKEHFNAYNA